MLELEERKDVYPICPYCEYYLEKVFMRKLLSFFGKRYIYFCSKYLKVLGVSHRKGFWMG